MGNEEGRRERLAISCLNGVVKLFSEIESSVCCYPVCVCVCECVACVCACGIGIGIGIRAPLYLELGTSSCKRKYFPLSLYKVTRKH